MGLGIEARLQAIQADPATTFEDYTLVRSALMRLLDPAAMGRFRVMAFGRRLAGRRPTEPPLGLFAFRLPARRPRRSDRRGGLEAPTREMPYCRALPPERSRCRGRSHDRTAGERGANLHARSARSAPRPVPRPRRRTRRGPTRPDPSTASSAAPAAPPTCPVPRRRRSARARC